LASGDEAQRFELRHLPAHGRVVATYPVGELARLSSGEWALIRPDGYVGAIVAGDEIPKLERYLAKVGVPAPL